MQLYNFAIWHYKKITMHWNEHVAVFGIAWLRLDQIHVRIIRICTLQSIVHAECYAMNLEYILPAYFMRTALYNLETLQKFS